jgi:hypothetical protein
VAVLLAIVFCVPLLLLGVPPLIPVPNLPDVPDPYRGIPAADNGWALLQQAADAVGSQPDFAHYPTPEPSQHAEVVVHLGANCQALALLDQALAKPDLELPRERFQITSPDASFEVFKRIQELARLKLQRAFVRHERGDLPGALRDAMDVVELGRRLSWDGVDLIELLNGAKIERWGLAAVRRCLAGPTEGTAPPLTKTERKAIEQALQQLLRQPPLLEAGRRAIAGEFIVERDYVVRYSAIRQMEHADRALPRWLYDRDRSVAAVQADTLATLRQLARPRWARDWSSESGLHRRRALWLYNCEGNRLVHELCPNGRRTASTLDGMIAWERLTAIHLAARLFLDRHGRLPSLGKEWRSAGLPGDWAVDPFDGHLLRCRPDDMLVYSIGRNGRDDGGQWDRGRNKQHDDIRARLLFVPTPTDAL